MEYHHQAFVHLQIIKGDLSRSRKLRSWLGNAMRELILRPHVGTASVLGIVSVGVAQCRFNTRLSNQTSSRRDNSLLQLAGQLVVSCEFLPYNWNMEGILHILIHTVLPVQKWLVYQLFSWHMLSPQEGPIWADTTGFVKSLRWSGLTNYEICKFEVSHETIPIRTSEFI